LSDASEKPLFKTREQSGSGKVACQSFLVTGLAFLERKRLEAEADPQNANPRVFSELTVQQNIAPTLVGVDHESCDFLFLCV